MSADERTELAEDAAALLARADTAMEHATSADRVKAQTILGTVGDDLATFTRDRLTVAVAMESAELARLHAEIEKRKESVHQRWSGLSFKHN